MTAPAGILHENKAYWSQRSAGYSAVNKEELAGSSRGMWKSAIHDQIRRHFPDRSADTINILDIGTGPGFFAILLAELGYMVTAADLTPAMLDEARLNAGSLASRIFFYEMNAEDLLFPDNTFDVVISRNLTWNLPHPEAAYHEWHRVLKKDGLLLNFDSNWYNYLFDDDARKAYDADRANSESLGIDDQNVGENFDIMEGIAHRLPLSQAARPSWDIDVLSGLGCAISVDEQIWKKVWTTQEQTNFYSTPLFMISAVK